MFFYLKHFFTASKKVFFKISVLLFGFNHTGTERRVLYVFQICSEFRDLPAASCSDSLNNTDRDLFLVSLLMHFGLKHNSDL